MSFIKKAWIFGFLWSFCFYWVSLITDFEFGIYLHFILFNLYLSALFWDEMKNAERK